MASDELDRRSADIDSKFKEILKKPSVGIRLDLLRIIMDDLDSNEKLISIFGSPVCGKLGIISEYNDLKIVDGKIKELSTAEEGIFLTELNKILKTRFSQFRGI